MAISNSTGLWTFSGSQTSLDGYTTKLTVTQPFPSDANTLDLSVTTSWNISPNRAQSVTLNGRLTNWKTTETTGNWSTISQLGQYLNSGGNYSDVAIIGDYAYLMSSSSSTITVLRYVTTPGSLALAGTFNAGASVTGIAARGTMLYLLTTDSSAELKTFDTKTSATAPTAGPTYNLPLSSVTPTALSIAGDFLYVTAR
jgi:hypothetical protein